MGDFSLSDEIKEKIKKHVKYYLEVETTHPSVEGRELTHEERVHNAIGNLLGTLPVSIKYKWMSGEEARARIDFFNSLTGTDITLESLIEGKATPERE